MGQHENHVRLAQQSQCRGAVKGGQSGPVWKNPRPSGKGRGGRHAGRALKGCLLSRSEPYAREAVAVPHRHSFVGAATDCTCGCGDGLTHPHEHVTSKAPWREPSAVELRSSSYPLVPSPAPNHHQPLLGPVGLPGNRVHPRCYGELGRGGHVRDRDTLGPPLPGTRSTWR